MRKLLSTSAIILALSAPAWAQSNEAGGGKDIEQRMEGTPLESQAIDRSHYPLLGETEASWSSDSLIGAPVQTADGEDIGTVESVVFTPDDRIMGLVVDTGEYLGSDSRPVVIDWYAVNVRPDEEMLVVDVTKDQLESAPDYAMTEAWRSEKKAEVPDIAESQPSVIGGEDVEGQGLAPAGAGGTDSGETGDGAGGGNSAQ